MMTFGIPIVDWFFGLFVNLIIAIVAAFWLWAFYNWKRGW